MPPPLELSLTLYPDPLLRQVAQPVTAFDEELRELVAAMHERMHKSKGVGLAAPQVGRRQRILVINPSGEPQDALTLVNPVIVSRAGQGTLFDEGCLSFPGIYAEIRRPERCSVRAYDVEGRAIEAEHTGFVSRILQHEYDHLEGVLLVDRMSPADKLRNRAALEELVARYKRSAPAPSR